MDNDTANLIREKFLDPLTENKLLEQRPNSIEDNRGREDGEFQRDYTRILYSSSFRRLQGKMQLFGIKEDQFFRNRLTHSLEVSQIARSIANQIGYSKEESFIVEAGALAHDIGNPPFGHAGERYLNKLAKNFGGFEGNAQTLRILTTVEQKRANFQGLNLTYRTLLSIVKYFNVYNPNLKEKNFEKQKFLYQRDYELIENIINDTGVKARTLDVQIVDLADEIAYAAHDLEDGLRQGIFTTDEIIHDFCGVCKNQEAINMLEKIFYDSKERASFMDASIDSAQYSKLYRKELASKIINILINDIGIVKLKKEEIEKRGTSYIEELGFIKYDDIAKGLKSTTYNCINHNDNVYAYEEKGEAILDFLFKFYKNKKHQCYLPPEYRATLVDKQYGLGNTDKELEELQNRLIIDYISGMMDTYAETIYYKLKSINE
ncbi:MAG: putative deoxyguanosinetriphosphate triphosphohydrolase [Herbinix sp.]|nr:putative deoxyguanosinetriphosphate triphosphohydrolase [Herbinix sp.]